MKKIVLVISGSVAAKKISKLLELFKEKKILLLVFWLIQQQSL